MAQLESENHRVVGPGGRLDVRPDDEITRKLMMLIEGECEGLGPIRASRKFGYCKQRYFQLRQVFAQQGAAALQSQKRGPKTNHRRSPEVVRQVIRHRFLDPDATPEVIAQKLRQCGWSPSIRSVQRIIAEYGLQKKLYQCRPQDSPTLETQRTKKQTRQEPCDPASLERGVRQLLADKVSGNLVGLWLLIPEHLRLGTWDLLCGWTQTPTDQVEPRLALQLVHEAALCVTGVRQQRTLSQRGFELAHGLPFVASDLAVHHLLDTHTVADSQRLQAALGKLRRASGDYPGSLLAIDPHRIHSSSKRQMRRFRTDQRTKPYKVVPTFFALDPDSHQPVCLTIATSAKTATTATQELLGLAAEILAPTSGQVLILADLEHSTADLLDYVSAQTPFDLLVPQMNQPSIVKQLKNLPADQFQPRWAGYATLRRPYSLIRGKQGPYCQFVQRSGETPETYQFQAFLCTSDREEVDALTVDFPKRWHVEEFFNTDQALGWNRGGTLNLNIRYGQMTMALLAQAVLHQLRKRWGEPWASWESSHFAKSVLAGLEGDIRVQGDTILVTYYNAPHADQLRACYERLPQRLAEENLSPEIPWLYNFKLDFRFK